jgi:hypothetical protein
MPNFDCFAHQTFVGRVDDASDATDALDVAIQMNPDVTSVIEIEERAVNGSVPFVPFRVKAEYLG